MIYLDNNATTQLDPAVLEAMLPFLKDHFANPSSAYSAAKPVRKAVNLAREQAAAFLDCDPDEIIFTSGGTEADNAAILSARRLYPLRHLLRRTRRRHQLPQIPPVHRRHRNHFTHHPPRRHHRPRRTPPRHPPRPHRHGHAHDGQ